MPKKKSKSKMNKKTWWWIVLGLIVVALIIYALVSGDGSTANTAGGIPAPPALPS